MFCCHFLYQLLVQITLVQITSKAIFNCWINDIGILKHLQLRCAELEKIVIDEKVATELGAWRVI